MNPRERPHVDRELISIAILLRRLEDDSIPAVLAMKRKVDAQQRLSDGDVEYLRRIIADVENFDVARLLEHHPDYSHLVGSFFSICRHVIESDLKKGEDSPRPR